MRFRTLIFEEECLLLQKIVQNFVSMMLVTLEFKYESDLNRLMELLQHFEVRVVKTIPGESKKQLVVEVGGKHPDTDNVGRLTASQFVSFLSTLNIQLPEGYRFNREEANGR